MFLLLCLLTTLLTNCVRFETLGNAGNKGAEEAAQEELALLPSSGSLGGGQGERPLEVERGPLLPALTSQTRRSSIWNAVMRMSPKAVYSHVPSLPVETSALALVSVSPASQSSPLPLPAGGSSSSLEAQHYSAEGSSFEVSSNEEVWAEWMRRQRPRRSSMPTEQYGRPCACEKVVGCLLPAVIAGACVSELCLEYRWYVQSKEDCERLTARQLQRSGCFLPSSHPPSLGVTSQSQVKASGFCRAVAEKALSKCTPSAGRAVRRIERKKEKGEGEKGRGKKGKKKEKEEMWG